MAAGLASVGYIEPDRKLTEMLLVPTTPLSLWIVEWLPVREDGRLRAIAQGGVFAMTIGAVSIAILFVE